MENLTEKFKFPDSCSSELCTTVMPDLVKIADLVSNFSAPAELVKIQTELNKLQKVVTEFIRSTQPTETAEKMDWGKLPKAPIFILNLKEKYPQNEDKYYRLWYKAASRQPVFSYGGAIVIFKTYCKREELVIEGERVHIKMFESFMNEAKAIKPYQLARNFITNVWDDANVSNNELFDEVESKIGKDTLNKAELVILDCGLDKTGLPFPDDEEFGPIKKHKHFADFKKFVKAVNEIVGDNIEI